MPGRWCRRCRCGPPSRRLTSGCSRTSPPGASATPPPSPSTAAPPPLPAARSGSTSRAAPICSAARRSCARICSRACGARAWPPRRRSPRRPEPPGRSPGTAMPRSCRRVAGAEALTEGRIPPRPPAPAHRAQLAFAEPIAQAEALAPVTRRLLAELCSALAAASLGARRLTLAFYRVDNSTAAIAVGTSRPCRDARQLERLLAEKLERVDLGFGIERAILEALAVEPLLPEPLAWRAMGAGDLDQARDLAPLVDRLSNRLGSGAVVRLVPRASHIPERAQRKAAPFALSPDQPEAQLAQALAEAP